jgi:hypothetical protein
LIEREEAMLTHLHAERRLNRMHAAALVLLAACLGSVAQADPSSPILEALKVLGREDLAPLVRVLPEKASHWKAWHLDPREVGAFRLGDPGEAIGAVIYISPLGKRYEEAQIRPSLWATYQLAALIAHEIQHGHPSLNGEADALSAERDVLLRFYLRSADSRAYERIAGLERQIKDLRQQR